jgi:dGTPase
MRTPYQRDRDRVVHATAFRRLTYKTQVFLFHEGDHYRTRLTHSLEVAQIARALARLLWLDEDLTEALALAHDLGHPPFGHAGERALDAVMARFGGFDHNAQSFRVVTRLERKYAAFDGLNLTFETLEGLVKHNGPLAPSAAVGRGTVLRKAIDEAGVADELYLELFGPAEAQAAALADDIAYNCHDLDDGLRAGLIPLAELPEVPLAGRFARQLGGASASDEQRLIYEVRRRMISALIEDAARHARQRLRALREQTLAGVRTAGRPVVALSPEMGGELEALQGYLSQRVYRHERVMKVMEGAEAIVRDLVEYYMRRPEDLPAAWRAAGEKGEESVRAGVVTDYVAGMTDRYALAEHRRLFDATPELR